MTTSLTTIETELKALQQQARDSINTVTNLDELDKLRVNYFGKKGQLSQVLRAMGGLSADDRPRIGALANEVKEELQTSLDDRRDHLQALQIQAKLASETLDVTMPAISRSLGRRHPLNQTTDKITEIFLGLGYTVATGPQIETDYYNFEALNTPPDHPARDMQDTFYFGDGRLLRTHTSSVQIRYMESHEPPIRVIAPGRVHRRDTVDATHSAVFHQVELLAVDKGLKFTDLKGTIKEFLRRMFGEDLEVQFRASYFPFTEPSAEVDVRWQGKWLEVMGCGMVDPNVLKAVGYDPEIYTGFAAGIGVERFALVLHQIDDIRRLYNSDLRFLRQF
jgi:phenylalanyl-tRNA synthetase alpha chain